MALYRFSGGDYNHTISEMNGRGESTEIPQLFPLLPLMILILTAGKLVNLLINLPFQFFMNDLKYKTLLCFENINEENMGYYVLRHFNH